MGSPGETPSGPASHLPWNLIPSFDPGVTDLQEYGRKLEFLAGIWPSEHLAQLAPRAALQCRGSAFHKVVRIPPEKLKTNSAEGVKLLVTTLGGVWGKTTLESRYEKFEQVIYATHQRSDESNDSYVARHEILFEDLQTNGASLEDVRAYILLRNSSLSADDKKRVLVESKGNLKYKNVLESIRMLGARFFQEVQGQTKASIKTKTYDINLACEQEDEGPMSEENIHFAGADPYFEISETVVDAFLAEGDDDAVILNQVEEALIDTLQNDQEMSTFMNTYMEARKRLSEKARSRGFWPVQGKGSWSSPGGKKGKGKSPMMRPRKPLALRIAESNCRPCGKRGHWRAECPSRPGATGSTSSKPPAASTLTTVVDDEVVEEDVFTMIDLPGDTVPIASDIQAGVVCMVTSRSQKDSQSNTIGPSGGALYQQVRSRLRQILPTMSWPRTSGTAHTNLMNPSNEPCPRESTETPNAIPTVTTPSHPGDSLKHPSPVTSSDRIMCDALFATSHSTGIVDLGASQSVMGQHQLSEFLESLPAQVRAQIREGPVNMIFRFGNNSTVPCHRAIYVPVGCFWIKIAIVESQTPFLISNNVCRSLGAVIDTGAQQIEFKRLGCVLPLNLSGKKLFTLDFHELVTRNIPTDQSRIKKPSAETVFHHSTQENNSQSHSHQHTQHTHGSELTHTIVPEPVVMPSQSFTQ